MTDQVKPIIEGLKKRIWEAEYYISINVNAVYWGGQKDGCEFALGGFRAVGISVSEITSKMKKPEYLFAEGLG